MNDHDSDHKGSGLMTLVGRLFVALPLVIAAVLTVLNLLPGRIHLRPERVG